MNVTPFCSLSVHVSLGIPLLFYFFRGLHKYVYGGGNIDQCSGVKTTERIRCPSLSLFLQLAYGRSQTAFSLGGIPVGEGGEELGKFMRSQIGTIYSSTQFGPRYLEVTEGYVLELGLDDEKEIIGYKF